MTSFEELSSLVGITFSINYYPAQSPGIITHLQNLLLLQNVNSWTGWEWLRYLTSKLYSSVFNCAPGMENHSANVLSAEFLLPLRVNVNITLFHTSFLHGHWMSIHVSCVLLCAKWKGIKKCFVGWCFHNPADFAANGHQFWRASVLASGIYRRRFGHVNECQREIKNLSLYSKGKCSRFTLYENFAFNYSIFCR